MKITLILFLLFISFSVSGQVKKIPDAIQFKPCNIALQDAPKFRGFYLRQPKKDFDLIPYFSEEYIESAKRNLDNLQTQLGYISVSSSSIFYRTPGVRQVSNPEYQDVDFEFGFLDASLISLSISYTEYEPSSLIEFQRQISDKTRLPFESWKVKNKNSAEMDCGAFNVAIWTGRDASRPEYQSYPNVVIIDKTAQRILEEREKEYHRKIEAAEREQQKRAAEAREARRLAELERKRQEELKRKIFKP